MRIFSFSGAGIVALGLVLAGTASSPIRADQSRAISLPARRGGQAAVQPVRPLFRRYAATTCSSSASDAFIGVPSGLDTAGGDDSSVPGGVANTACDGNDGIGGGESNTIGQTGGDAFDSFIGAGDLNSISSFNSFVGAGNKNYVSGANSFIGAGDYYYSRAGGTMPGNQVSGTDAFVGAGDLNVVSGSGGFIGGGDYAYAETGATTAGNQVSGIDSFIGAGDQNVVAGQESFVGGGQSNDASGQKSTIGGGESNEALGSFAVVPGGYHDEALGNESFAAGSQAEAKFTGSFVWSDYVAGEAPLNDGEPDQFVVRASGGVYMYSNAKSPYAGVELPPGAGTWASVSDRNAKTDFVPIDDASILAKVTALPVSAWRYKTESGVRHVGPMAQDFYAAFGVGEDDRHITSIDEDGVALAAIKGLDAKLARKNEALRARLDAVEARNAALERRLDALAARMKT